jgi:hypothetical protein
MNTMTTQEKNRIETLKNSLRKISTAVLSTEHNMRKLGMGSQFLTEFPGILIENELRRRAGSVVRY